MQTYIETQTHATRLCSPRNRPSLAPPGHVCMGIAPLRSGAFIRHTVPRFIHRFVLSGCRSPQGAMERGELELPDWNVALKEQQDSFDCSPVKQPLVQVSRPLPAAEDSPRQPPGRDSHGQKRPLVRTNPPRLPGACLPFRLSLRMATGSASLLLAAQKGRWRQVRLAVGMGLGKGFGCAAAYLL